MKIDNLNTYLADAQRLMEQTVRLPQEIVEQQLNLQNKMMRVNVEEKINSVDEYA